MIFQFVISASILRKLGKQILKRYWVNCSWFLALGKGRATESACPKDPREPRSFLRSFSSKRSACYAKLGWLDASAEHPPPPRHARAKFLKHDVMTIFPHEREPSPLETVESFFRVVGLKVYC